MDNQITCSVVVPMYNEEEVAHETFKRLKKAMSEIGETYEVIFVNDGSRDKTAEILTALCDEEETFKLIDFSRNFGHQIAITAGMDYSSGECVVVIDGDLQDPPEVIGEMIQKWKEGYDVVYGKRLKRKGDTLFKKVTAKIFYRFLRRMTDVDIPVDTGDFRLIDAKLIDDLKRINEKHRYVRGLISWLGYKQTAVEFVREERFAGETKYPLKKMISFAVDAITSFSYKPLRLATVVGSLVALLSILYLVVVIVQRLFFGETVVEGWASTLAVSLFFNGIMLMMLGIIGSYIGRIYDEVKNRPLYIVNKATGFDDSKADGRHNSKRGE